MPKYKLSPEERAAEQERKENLRNITDIPHKRIYDRVLGMCVPIMFNGVNFRKEEAAAKMEAAKKRFGMEDRKQWHL